MVALLGVAAVPLAAASDCPLPNGKNGVCIGSDDPEWDPDCTLVYFWALNGDPSNPTTQFHWGDLGLCDNGDHLGYCFEIHGSVVNQDEYCGTLPFEELPTLSDEDQDGFDDNLEGIICLTFTQRDFINTATIPGTCVSETDYDANS